MSAKTVTLWTCDRCEQGWTTKVGQQWQQPPEPWGSLRWHCPPKSAESSVSWTLCPSCESAFARWIERNEDACDDCTTEAVAGRSHPRAERGA